MRDFPADERKGIIDNIQNIIYNNYFFMQEYLDVLDEDGKATGKSASREEVHSHGVWHLTAQVLLMNLQGEILVHRRARNKKYYPGLWDVYFGGHVLSGETPSQALIREAQEETNLILKGKDFQFLFDIKKADVQNDGNFINNDFAQVYLAQKDFDLTELALQVEEIEEVKFISLAKLQEIVTADGQDFIPREHEYELLFKALKVNRQN